MLTLNKARLHAVQTARRSNKSALHSCNASVSHLENPSTNDTELYNNY